MEKENFLTLEMMLGLPSKILDISKHPNSEYLGLIEESKFKEFDFPKLKSCLLTLFKEFNNTKYSLSMSGVDYKYTTDGIYRENKLFKNTSDKVGNYVASKIDAEKLSVDIYNKVVSLSYKLTMEEAIYFIDTFFARKSEEAVSEKIGISRTYLQRIKKSCLIKMYKEFYDMIC